MPADAMSMRERRAGRLLNGARIPRIGCEQASPSPNEMDEHIQCAVDRKQGAISCNCANVCECSHQPLNGRCCECLPISRSLHYDDSCERLGLHDCLKFGRYANRKLPNVASLYYLARQLLCVGSQWLFASVSFVVILANESFQEVLKRVAALQARRRADERERERERESENENEMDESEAARATSGRDQQEWIALAQCGKVARSLFSNMCAAMSLSVLRFAGLFFSWLLGNHLTSLTIPHGQLEMLRQAANRKLPILFVPLHRSHLDYIVLHYALLRCGIMVPYVAAGDNLNIPLIGWFLRHLGAFFIRRKVGPHDTIYRAVLNCYVEELLKSNMNIEFYIEGGRSRSGRACPPRTGLLSVVVDTLLDKRIDDVLIVPIAIQYELVFDRSLIREQLGLQKQRESVAHTLASVRRLFNTQLGQIRIDFCQPMQLSEFVRMHNQQQSTTDQCDVRRAPPLSRFRFSRTSSELASSASICSFTTQTSGACSFSGESQLALSEFSRSIVDQRRRALVQKLAQHVMHSAMQAQTLMATNLTAFLLLTTYRDNSSMAQLAAAFYELYARLTTQQRHCGFSLQSASDAITIVERSVRMLNKNFVPLRQTSSAGMLICVDQSLSANVRPNLNARDAALTLAYYAAPVQSAFGLQSIVVTAALSLAAEHRSFDLRREAHEFEFEFSDSACVVEVGALRDRAQQLAAMLQNEFCLFAPCTTFEAAFNKALARCISERLLVKLSSGVPAFTAARHFRSEPDSETEADDDGLTIDLDAYASDNDDREQLPQRTAQTFFAIRVTDVASLRCLKSHAYSIVPLVDAYSIVFEQCVSLGHDDEDDASLFGRIMSAAELKSKRFTETFSLDTLRRALHTFVLAGALEKYTVNGVTHYQLGEQFANADSRTAYAKLLRLLALDC